jgi:methyl-galactoside transport system substrate-binding protein
MGKAIVAIAENAATGKSFLEGTSYSLADDAVSVRIPYAPVQTVNAPEGGAAVASGPVTFGVLIYKYDDTYISTVRTAIEKYAGAAATSITLDMQDGQGDQAKQNDQLDVLIQKNVDVLVINAVDAGSAQGIADKAKAAGIPAVFFNREPAKEVIESCDGIFIGTTASEAGVMQGDLLAELWAANPQYDRNGDGKVQFVVFKGEPGNPEAEARTSFAQSQAEARGLTLENVNGEPLVANWATDQAQTQMEALLAAHDDIEAVFANNDDMALGVIAALNSVGFNTGADDTKWIPVIGVDATDAGLEAINTGRMAATVKQDGDAMGKAIVAIAENAALGKDFLGGTSYSLADDGVSVRIPYAPVQTTSAPAGGAAVTAVPVTFGVLIYKYDDTYISTVRAAIEKYAGEAAATITLDMQDGQGDQAKQNDQLDVLIQKGVNVLVINAVDAGSAQGIADKAKAAGIPAVFFNREPAKDVIESCGGIFIGTTASEAGVMQGDLLADMWTANPQYDRNGDGKVQFVVFKGEPGNPEAEARTAFAQSQAEARGLTLVNVNGEPLVANWATDQAQTQMEALLAAHDDIEAVFANNDDMALGIIAALNSIGFNTGADATKWIPVIGVDATDAGLEAINTGRMAATVKQDGDAMGKAIVAIAENAALGKGFLDGTSYVLADDAVSVRIPYAPVQQ